jgi:hypothetical protein
MRICLDWSEFTPLLDKKMLLLSPFCGRPQCETLIKDQSVREEPADQVYGDPNLKLLTMIIFSSAPPKWAPKHCAFRWSSPRSQRFPTGASIPVARKRLNFLLFSAEVIDLLGKRHKKNVRKVEKEYRTNYIGWQLSFDTRYFSKFKNSFRTFSKCFIAQFVP